MSTLRSGLLAACIAAAVPAQGAVDTFALKNGEHVRAEVISVSDDRAVLRELFEGGSMHVTRRFAELEPHSVYRILRGAADTRQPDALLKLAAFAADQGLVAAAQRDLEDARRLASQPDLAPELAQRIEDRGGALLEGLIRRAVEGKLDLPKARRLLADLSIRFPGSTAAQRRAELAALLRDAEQRSATEKRAAEAAAAVAKLDAARRKTLQAIEKHLEDGDAENERGLLKSKHFATAHQHFLAAVQHTDKALRGVAAAAKTGDDELAGELEALQQRAVRQRTDALLNAGSVALVRGQLTHALGHVNAVLAADPGNRDARDMRARIEVAANQRTIGGVAGY